MSRGISRYFDYYDEKNNIFLHRIRVKQVSKLLNIHYTRVYDIANLQKDHDGVKLFYSEEKERTVRFYCQCCRTKTKQVPVTYEDDFVGEIKLCSIKCKSIFESRRK